MKFKNLLLISITAIILSLTVQSRVPVVNTVSDFINYMDARFLSLFGDGDTYYRVVKFGYNLDLDTAASEDVISQGGLMTFPSSAETLGVVSSDAADDDGSTGAESVFITGILGDGTQASEVVTLNGTSEVVTTNAYLFVNRAVVLSSGSGLKNAGTITIDQTTSGAVLASIPAGTGTTQQINYRVPSTHRCYINDLYVSADKLSGSSPRVTFLIKVFNTVTSNTEYIIRRELIDTSVTDRMQFPHFKEQALLPGEIMSIEASTTSNDTQVSATIDMTCKKD